MDRGFLRDERIVDCYDNTNDSNPLENISNTRKISAVVANGRYLSKEELQKMLADVEAKASKN